MNANVLPRIFTIEIGDTPTLTFEALNLREAHELCATTLTWWLSMKAIEYLLQGG